MIRLFMIDGESASVCTLRDLLVANVDTFSLEDIASLAALKVGDAIAFGGGAFAETTIERVGCECGGETGCVLSDGGMRACTCVGFAGGGL